MLGKLKSAFLFVFSIAWGVMRIWSSLIFCISIGTQRMSWLISKNTSPLLPITFSRTSFRRGQPHSIDRFFLTVPLWWGFDRATIEPTLESASHCVTSVPIGDMMVRNVKVKSTEYWTVRGVDWSGGQFAPLNIRWLVLMCRLNHYTIGFGNPA